MIPIPREDASTYIQIRDTARKFADEAVRPLAEALDRDETFPAELIAGWRPSGCSASPFPPSMAESGSTLTPTQS